MSYTFPRSLPQAFHKSIGATSGFGTLSTTGTGNNRGDVGTGGGKMGL